MCKFSTPELLSNMGDFEHKIIAMKDSTNQTLGVILISPNCVCLQCGGSCWYDEIVTVGSHYVQSWWGQSQQRKGLLINSALWVVQYQWCRGCFLQQQLLTLQDGAVHNYCYVVTPFHSCRDVSSPHIPPQCQPVWVQVWVHIPTY